MKLTWFVVYKLYDPEFSTKDKDRAFEFFTKFDGTISKNKIRVVVNMDEFDKLEKIYELPNDYEIVDIIEIHNYNDNVLRNEVKEIEVKLNEISETTTVEKKTNPLVIFVINSDIEFNKYLIEENSEIEKYIRENLKLFDWNYIETQINMDININNIQREFANKIKPYKCNVSFYKLFQSGNKFTRHISLNTNIGTEFFPFF